MMIPDPIANGVMTTTQCSVETAYEWWKRSNRARRSESDAPEIPTDPSSAARAFFRPSRSTNSRGGTGTGTGTGIAFVDAALVPSSLRGVPHASALSSHKNQSIVLEISGDYETGKTCLTLSLAARFVVSTRPSQFQSTSTCHVNAVDRRDFDNESDSNEPMEDDTSHPDDSIDATGDDADAVSLPQVLVLDSNFGVDIPKLAHMVRSCLLMQPTTAADSSHVQVPPLGAAVSCDDSHMDVAVSIHHDPLESDTHECLDRIHVAMSDDLGGWIAILESIRTHLVSSHVAESTVPPPTLVLWDGLLSEPTVSSEAEAVRREVIRQLERLLVECHIVLVITTHKTHAATHTAPLGAGAGRDAWDRLVTHRIHLTRTSGTTVEGPPSESRHDTYMASVYGVPTPIPFAISVAGILS